MQTANASASIRVKNAFWFSWKSSLTVVVCGIRVVLGWLRGGYIQHLRADARNLCCAPKIPQRSPEIYKTCASDRKSCVNAKACLPPPEADTPSSQCF